jgi:hypothetical protein
MRFSLAPRADLGVFYEADAPRYRAAHPEVLDLVTKEVFTVFYEKCPSIGFAFDNAPIGGIIFDGRQAHIAVLPAWHGRWAHLLRPALDWLFGLAPEILVDVECENSVCIEFMRRNGWPALREANGWITYRMTPQARRHRHQADASLSH